MSPDVRNSSHALLVMVHGSPRATANADMLQVLDLIRGRDVYPIVVAGFMECNEPDIPTAIAQCVADGATAVTAVPYFLHTGKHVAQDLPALLEAARNRYTHVVFRLGAYLGRSSELTDILEARIRESLEGCEQSP